MKIKRKRLLSSTLNIAGLVAFAFIAVSAGRTSILKGQQHIPAALCGSAFPC